MTENRDMRSIVRLAAPDDIKAAIAAIEAVTMGKVIAYTVYDFWISFEIQHHDDALCPKCGGVIHPYGHGLCRMCWLSEKKSIGAV